MKSVLISIRPKWCTKILSGEKTVEIRRTRPLLEPPFRGYLYCTEENWARDAQNRLWRTDSDGEKHLLNGRVIGEFVCSGIHKIQANANLPANLQIAACMTASEAYMYLGSSPGFGWRISDLRLYKQPRELKEFRRVCREELRCESCAMHREYEESCGNETLHLSRAPQSWCYVEESV